MLNLQINWGELHPNSTEPLDEWSLYSFSSSVVSPSDDLCVSVSGSSASAIKVVYKHFTSLYYCKEYLSFVFSDCYLQVYTLSWNNAKLLWFLVAVKYFPQDFLFCLFDLFICLLGCAGSWASHAVLVLKNLPANAGHIRDVGSVPGSGRSPGGGQGDSLHYSCLENPMNRAAWQATVHRVIELDTTEATEHTHTRWV